jgi:hypothetical protein
VIMKIFGLGLYLLILPIGLWAKAPLCSDVLSSKSAYGELLTLAYGGKQKNWDSFVGELQSNLSSSQQRRLQQVIKSIEKDPWWQRAGRTYGLVSAKSLLQVLTTTVKTDPKNLAWRRMGEMSLVQRQALLLGLTGKMGHQVQSDWVNSQAWQLNFSFWLSRSMSAKAIENLPARDRIDELLVTPGQVSVWQRLKSRWADELVVLHLLQNNPTGRHIVIQSLEGQIKSLQEYLHREDKVDRPESIKELMMRTHVLKSMLEKGRALSTKEIQRVVHHLGLPGWPPARVRALQWTYSLLPSLSPRVVAEVASLTLLAYVLQDWFVDEPQTYRFNEIVLPE